MIRLSDLGVEELADGICLRAGRIAAAEAELLAWIGEFDRREGWAGTGMLSCAHWLSWRIGLSLPTAREQVRVSRRLKDLPQLAAAFGDGRVSYSKVRAITRVAEPDDRVDWVQLARHSSAAQLEKIARGVRRAQANQAAGLDPEAAAWSLRTRVRYDDNGNFTLTISGPAPFLPVVQAGLEAKRAALQRQRDLAAAATAADDDGVQTSDVVARVHPGQGQQEHKDASAEASAPAPAPVPVRVPVPEEPAASPVAEEGLRLAEQAPGWPDGTTWRQVQQLVTRFRVFQQTYTEQPPEGAAPIRASAQAFGAAGASAEAFPVAEAPTGAPVTAPAAAGSSTDAPEPARVTDAEALLALAEDALAAEQAAHPDTARRRRPQLTLQIDPLSGWARQRDGELLPPSSLRPIVKSLPGSRSPVRMRPLTPADLRRHDLGRRQREVSLALRELLGTLDGERCRFPGCTRSHKLHAHHLVHWSQGGPTDLANLVLACSRHHNLIHQVGFQLVLHADRSLDVSTPEGTRLLHHPAQPWGDPQQLDPDHDVSAETLAPDGYGRMDLGYVVEVLLHQAA